MSKQSILVLTLLAAAASAQAHSVWLEQPASGGHAVLRFGHFDLNLREASPGLLDHFVQPKASLISADGERELSVQKGATGFDLPLAARAGQSIVAEEAAYPLRQKKDGDKEVTSWYYPAARLVTTLAAQPAKLTLDIVPAGTPGKFKVYFKGQPLPKAKVEWATQSGWTKQARTDAQGEVTFDMPWSGQYVAQVLHRDDAPGERPGGNGKADHYDVVSYMSTLTYIKPTGIKPLPAGPARPANVIKK